MIKVVKPEDAKLVTKAKDLVQEYAASLGYDLCFQDFDQEMAAFPDQYSPPDGSLIVAQSGDTIVGCVGLRKLSDSICEMKRMYVQPEFRGKGLGRALTVSIINEAKSIGYEYMRLDTIPLMEVAIHLYVSLGFKDIDPYRVNPIEGARYMELRLRE